MTIEMIYYDWTPESMLEVTLPEPDNFLKVRETLTRIGIASRKENKLYQSCHILHKQGRYFIVHFKELFALENLNHTNRTRNRKRGMYMRLVEYVANCDKVGEPFRSKYECSLIMQCKYPQLQRNINNFRLVYEIDKVVKEKVNGKLVMEWCNLSESDGQMVGKIMSEVRNIPKFILLEMSQSEIKNKVVDVFANLVIVEE